MNKYLHADFDRTLHFVGTALRFDAEESKDPAVNDDKGSAVVAGNVVAGKDPAVIAGKDPAVVAGKDPAVVAGKDPAVVAGKDPAVVAGKDPAVVAGKDPAVVAGKDPAVTAGKDPAVTAGKDHHRSGAELGLAVDSDGLEDVVVGPPGTSLYGRTGPSAALIAASGAPCCQDSLPAWRISALTPRGPVAASFVAVEGASSCLELSATLAGRPSVSLSPSGGPLSSSPVLPSRGRYLLPMPTLHWPSPQ